MVLKRTQFEIDDRGKMAYVCPAAVDDGYVKVFSFKLVY